MHERDEILNEILLFFLNIVGNIHYLPFFPPTIFRTNTHTKSQ